MDQLAQLPLLTGECVAGRFVIGQTARAGGMSTVYQARDLQTGGCVAIKLLNPAYCSPQGVLRLALEAQVLAKLQHPGIVSYISHGRTSGGLPFLAMEWLEGEDLAQRIHHKSLSLTESLSLLRRVAAALAAVHHSGVLHRDIKPSNLFLRDGQIEQVTLVDFGIARETVQARPLTGNGSVIGTPEYMAPERMRGVRDISAAADVFSLGCVLFECLTGRLPFLGGNLLALLTKMMREEAPLLRTLRPDAPEAVERILARMLAKPAAVHSSAHFKCAGLRGFPCLPVLRPRGAARAQGRGRDPAVQVWS